MNFFGFTKSNITKDKNGDNVPYLEIAEVVLVHCNVVIVIIDKNPDSCIHLFLTNLLVNYYLFRPEILYI